MRVTNNSRYQHKVSLEARVTMIMRRVMIRAIIRVWVTCLPPRNYHVHCVRVRVTIIIRVMVRFSVRVRVSTLTLTTTIKT